MRHKRLKLSVLLLLGLEVAVLQAQSVKDIEGNVYKAVTIGGQVWMVENLKTTKYNDGTPIPLVTNDADWRNLTSPGYCWYNNDQKIYGNTYGALYNWYTINTDKLCPTGWHVPNDNEWTTLTDYLGGLNVAGGKLKEKGTTHWNSRNKGANNKTGFTALPGGNRNFDGTFDNVGGGGYWWSATEDEDDDGGARGRGRGISYGSSDVYRLYDYEQSGFSIRCLRD